MATSIADVLAKAKKKAQGNRGRTVKPTPGKSVWRILPGWDPKDPARFVQEYGQHFVKDMDGNIVVVAVCPEKTFDEPCEICEAVSKAAQSAPNDKLREKILESKATQRFLFNAINTAQPDKVEILEVGSMLFADMAANIEEDPSIIDPEQGRDLVITREGTGMNTRYSLAVRAKDKSIKVSKSALMSLHDLADYVNEDFEVKKAKALKSLGVSAGVALAAADSKALSGPLDDDLMDDEIPDFDAEAEAKKELAADDEVEDADVEYDKDDDDKKTAGDSDFDEEISDDDIEAMLNDID